MISFSMMRRRPRIGPPNIQRQTHGCTESTFVIFENLRARKIAHDFLVRGLGRAWFAHWALRSAMPDHPCGSHHCARSKMRSLSATVVHVKSPHEGGANESLPSKIRGLLFARCAQMPKKRPTAF